MSGYGLIYRSTMYCMYHDKLKNKLKYYVIDTDVNESMFFLVVIM
jgi:hypothetical protein